MVSSGRLLLERRLRAAVLALLLCALAASGFSVAGQQESTCEANGSIYFVGEWYFLDSDHCTQCECTAEGSACSRTECTSLPAACIHVSHYPTDCCPRCEKIGCEYRGVVYELGQNFQVRLKAIVVIFNDGDLVVSVWSGGVVERRALNYLKSLG